MMREFLEQGQCVCVCVWVCVCESVCLWCGGVDSVCVGCVRDSCVCWLCCVCVCVCAVFPIMRNSAGADRYVPCACHFLLMSRRRGIHHPCVRGVRNLTIQI